MYSAQSYSYFDPCSNQLSGSSLEKCLRNIVEYTIDHEILDFLLCALLFILGFCPLGCWPSNNILRYDWELITSWLMIGKQKQKGKIIYSLSKLFFHLKQAEHHLSKTCMVSHYHWTKHQLLKWWKPKNDWMIPLYLLYKFICFVTSKKI